MSSLAQGLHCFCLRIAGCLVDTAEDHKGVAIVPGLARTKLDVVLPGSARGGRAPGIRRPCDLRVRGGLRAGHREAEPRYDDQSQQDQQPG